MCSFLSHETSGNDTVWGPPVLASQPVRRQRRYALHFVVFTLRVDHCPEHHSSAADRHPPPRTAHWSHAGSCPPLIIMARAGTTCHRADAHIHGGPGPSPPGGQVTPA